MKKTVRNTLAVVLLIFGLLTLFLSSSIILDLFNIREKEGNYVPFIVWTNFSCSILYLISVYGLLKIKKWTALLLALASMLLVIAFIALKIYIGNGGIYETKTVGAMIFRAVLTIVFSVTAYLVLKTDEPKKVMAILKK